MQQAQGTVHLVGAGPGDPELLTIRAMRALETADVVVYDHHVSSAILQFCHSNAELVYAGKTKGCHALSQSEINATLLRLAREPGHASIVRLKGGDPFIFGRGGEELQYLRSHGVTCEVIPGITAACGAAAQIGIPLTHRDYSSEVVILTGHKRSDGDYSDFRRLDLSRQTCVVYMGLSVLPEIMAEVAVTNPGEPVCIIENATRPEARYVTGTAESIADAAENAKLQSPALVILGRVVGLLETDQTSNQHRLSAIQTTLLEENDMDNKCYR